MDTEEIKSIVNEIRSSMRYNKREYFTEKYHNFVENYPKLFEAAVNDKFPLGFLDIMLDQLKLLNNKQTNLDSADAKIYGTLREKYIDPYVPQVQKE